MGAYFSLGEGPSEEREGEGSNPSAPNRAWREGVHADFCSDMRDWMADPRPKPRKEGTRFRNG